MSGGIDPQELAKIEKEKAQQRETVKKLNDQIEKYKILNDEIQSKFYELQMKLAKLEQENEDLKNN